MEKGSEFVEVKVLGVVKSLKLTSPSEIVPLELTPVFLLEDDKKRVITVNIGERFSIVNEALRGGLTPYNTIVSVLENLKVSVSEILIYGAGEDFRAKVNFQLGSDRRIEKDANPCDAIMFSILTKAPIYVDKRIMEEFSVDASELIR